MGCASSLNRDVIRVSKDWKRKNGQPVAYHSRETRILQEEEVDVCLNDEYDVIESDWIEWPEDYQMLEEKGAWVKGVSSGGSRNDLEQFSTNPQFSLNVGPPELVAESMNFDPYTSYFKDATEEKKIKLCVSLTQHGPKLLHVAFFIYKKESWPGERLGAEFFLVVEPEGDTGAFVNWRQLKHEYSLLPGAYVIVTANFTPGSEGEFAVAVRGPKPFTLTKIPQDQDFI
ncbi:calpain-9-like [Cimex lectularius]|uniref:Peptidase C2 calpain domain-containing protein n=1 Tax=Cimex lectularius TaxID=79782 RepID=A0A8I6TDE1_CIMLE|nr:calpain-9-like [Cimex lectularius]XP_014246301.1 calpain-9-like [Cimex lectularius]XP_014246303.1 calpain-9-like [Cimex lectularius]